MNIIRYKPEYSSHFEKLNKAWLNKYFQVEPIDEWVLTHPEEAILQEGGTILFAQHQGQIIGTVALKWVEPGVFELTKMAVAEAFQGRGAGKLLCTAAIEEAKTREAERLILYSNSLLKNAIHLYQKLGFTHLPVQEGIYKRADIKMELALRSLPERRPTIYIVGAGAIGKALAVALTLSHKQVVLLRGSIDDQPQYAEKLQVLFPDKTELEADIEVSTLSNFPTLEGIIVLTTKSYGNARLANVLKGKVKHSPIVILQNGLGVEQVFMDNHFPEIYRCVLFVTSQLITDSKVSFKPVSVSPIGLIKGNDAHLPGVVQQLNCPHFQFKPENDIQMVIWKKAIINSVFNSICPLLEVDNGIFYRNEVALAMARDVIEECVAIATAKGILLTADEVTDSLLLISRSSDGQYISTLQDIKQKRKTEIETLNFQIVSMAKAIHKEGVVKATKLLGEMTKLKADMRISAGTQTV